MEAKVLILSIIGTVILLALMAGAIITIIVTRNKSNEIEKILHYVGIGILCITAIHLLPILCNFLGDLIIIGLIVFLVNSVRRK